MTNPPEVKDIVDPHWSKDLTTDTSMSPLRLRAHVYYSRDASYFKEGKSCSAHVKF
jgi:hypothetical protein